MCCNLSVVLQLFPIHLFLISCNLSNTICIGETCITVIFTSLSLVIPQTLTYHVFFKIIICILQNLTVQNVLSLNAGSFQKLHLILVVMML